VQRSNSGRRFKVEKRAAAPFVASASSPEFRNCPRFYLKKTRHDATMTGGDGDKDFGRGQIASLRPKGKRRERAFVDQPGKFRQERDDE